jgi:hypothetical protein
MYNGGCMFWSSAGLFKGRLHSLAIKSTELKEVTPDKHMPRYSSILMWMRPGPGVANLK